MTQRNRSSTRAAPLALTHPNAAGIDIGSASHFVAVPPDRDDEPVREFRSFTGELHRLAEWLAECGIDTVAMESTGVYWIPLFELLDARGFTVLLVNARHVKNVSGRKSDVLDCQWLQQLMSYGLLRGAFRPGDAVCALRALVRQRATILRTQSRAVQHMQKALVQMNIQLATVIADVVGASGQAILRAIVAGERDGHRTRCAVRRAYQGQCRRSRRKLARPLARRAPVCAEAGARRLRLLWHATGRVRRRDRGAACRPAGHRRRARQGQEALEARATRPSSICARGCSRCAAWI